MLFLLKEFNGYFGSQFQESGIRVCLSRFCCQRFSNCHSVCQRFIKVLSILFIRRFMVYLLEGFSLSDVLMSKGFFRFCFLFLWVYMLCQRFFFSGSLCLSEFWVSEGCFRSFRITGLGGSVGCAVRLETRRSRVQPPPRSATFFRGD